MKGRVVRLMLVSDPRWSEERIARAAEGAASAVPDFAVQLRDRSERTDEELLPFAMRLREITARRGAMLIVNRRFELARRAGADGVHAPLAQRPPFDWWSAPAHGDEEVLRASRAGADAVLVSPIFAVPGKGAARGVEAVRQACALAPKSWIIALGGVDAGNAGACFEAGASGVAVMRALLDAEDPSAAARSLVAGRD